MLIEIIIELRGLELPARGTVSVVVRGLPLRERVRSEDLPPSSMPFSTMLDMIPVMLLMELRIQMRWTKSRVVDRARDEVEIKSSR